MGERKGKRGFKGKSEASIRAVKRISALSDTTFRNMRGEITSSVSGPIINLYLAK